MARPRSFDADEVLDRAADAFRAKGYDGTSIDDLERATGLRRASLYGAFKDKHSLYLAALRRYDAAHFARLSARLDAETSGRRAIARLFESVLSECAKDRGGCLMANAAMERGGMDDGAARCVADNRRRIEGALRAAVLRGRADGSVRGERDASAQARSLFCVLLGIRALRKSGCSRAELEDVAESALKAV
jgi:AcrR family transcriptional regulator